MNWSSILYAVWCVIAFTLVCGFLISFLYTKYAQPRLRRERLRQQGTADSALAHEEEVVENIQVTQHRARETLVVPAAVLEIRVGDDDASSTGRPHEYFPDALPNAFIQSHPDFYYTPDPRELSRHIGASVVVPPTAPNPLQADKVPLGKVQMQRNAPAEDIYGEPCAYLSKAAETAASTEEVSVSARPASSSAGDSDRVVVIGSRDDVDSCCSEKLQKDHV